MIHFVCGCGKRFKAKREFAGRQTSCQNCGRELLVPSQATEECLDPPGPTPPVLPETYPRDREAVVTSSGNRGSWHVPAMWVGAAVPTIVLFALLGYNYRGTTSNETPEVEKPAARNPRIPVEVSYPVIDEAIAKDLSGTPYKRIISVRLNIKVPEQVLREIALELKAKEIKQYEYTRINFFLSGKGPDKGPGNTSAWAMADFDSGLRITIMGFSIEEERTYRTAPLELPVGSKPLGTWILEDGFVKTRITIYQRDGRWFYHLQWAGTEEPGAIEMEELPSETGHILRMRKSSDRYIVGAQGDLEIRNSEEKLLSRPERIVPPPPER